MTEDRRRESAEGGSKPRSPADQEVVGQVQTPPDEMGTDTWAPAPGDVRHGQGDPTARPDDRDPEE